MQKVPQDVRAAARKARVDSYQYAVDSDVEEDEKTAITASTGKPSEAEITEMEKQLELDKK